MGEPAISRSTKINTDNAVRRGRNNEIQDKKMQLSIILSSNPADDGNLSMHTWIRSIGDIHTFKEAMVENGFTEDDDFTPDFKADDVRKALRSGYVTVYSSHRIKNGEFVTPSRMEAQNYAGSGRVYSLKVRLTDVAWIDNLQGQYARTRR